MIGAGPTARVLADSVVGLPEGLRADPAGPADVTDAVEVMREVEAAGCGRRDANAVEVAEEMGGPDARWGEGVLLVRRGPAAVAVVITYDGLAEDRGWDVDAYVRPDDPDREAILACVLDAGLAEGRARWSRLHASGLKAPIARSYCFANDDRSRAVLESRGFAEARRYWRMRVEHAEGAGTAAGPPGPALPAGYLLRTASGAQDVRGVHAVGAAAFADAFDSTPLPFERWLQFMTGPTHAPDQWTVVELAGGIVGYALGSTRLASTGAGYIASLAVLAEHRGRGLGTALLHARFADDARRGMGATVLHCDSENTSGATRVYQRAGMSVDQEMVAFHRPLAPGTAADHAGADAGYRGTAALDGSLSTGGA